MVQPSSTNQKLISARLSPELTKEYKVRSMQIRKGDTVRVQRGSFKDVEGKVTQVNRRDATIHVEGVTREKSEGSTRFLPIHPSKTMILKLNLEDNRRKDILKRKASKPLAKASETPDLKPHKSKET